MAFIRTDYCSICGADMPHVNGHCRSCEERKAREHMAAWLAKTPDEKLLDLHHRLTRLERKPADYA